MRTFTFDTNCLIDIEEARPSKNFILDIIKAHREHRATAAFVAVSASERQQGDVYLKTYSEFMKRLSSSGLEDIPQIKGRFSWDISYWDNAIYADDIGIAREQEIHNILFPNIEFYFSDFAQSTGVQKTDVLSKYAHKWRNAWCDRQMIWAHDYGSRDVFVTSDKNFKKLCGKEGFESIFVCTPEEAVELLD